MQTLPKHILNSLLTNKTSLGDHPSYPPEEEDKFIVSLIKKYFDEISEGIDVSDVNKVKSYLSKLIVKCKKIETKNNSALEALCIELLTDIFKIPSDSIDLEFRLVDKVDCSNQRLTPEGTGDDFEFDDIDDMNNLSDTIYKRRMLNCLIEGASIYYASNIDAYLNKLFNIDPELPALYKKIFRLNDVLSFLEKDSIDNENITEGGKVDVYLQSPPNVSKIKAEGLIFPTLLEQAIKGLFEIAISHGLPNDRKKAEYVMKKADFRLAEVWDTRLGVPLWKLIVSEFEKIDVDVTEVGANFILMEIAMLDNTDFNTFLREVFGRTKKGKKHLKSLAMFIQQEQERDSFKDFMDKMNDRTKIEDDCFTSDELLNEVDSDE